MANTLRIKRRASGAAGAPDTLKNAELAFNEVDNTLYYGKGLDVGTGNAVNIIAIAGDTAKAGTADKLTTARTITLTGDVAGSTTFDGSANVSITAELSDTGVTAGTYGSSTAIPTFTVDVDGRITSASTTSITVGDGLLTVQGSNGLTGSGTFSANQGTAATITLSHADTSSVANLSSDNANGVVIQDLSLTFDAYGHVTGATVATFDLDGRYYTETEADNRFVNVAGDTLTGFLTLHADPTNALHAVTKQYVDMAVQGLDPKQSVKAATTTNLAALSGTLTVDGVALVAGDRVLVKDQTTASQNGIYVVAAGAWTRASDADTWAELVSAFVFVEQGTTNADNGFLCSVDAGGTLGTTAVTFVQFSGAGQIVAGAGLTKTGNQLDIGTASTARIVVNADNIDLATIGTAGTYRSVTVDAYGRVSAGTNPTTLSGYGITDAQPLDADLTAIAALAGTSGFLKKTAADTWTLDTNTYLTGNQSITISGDASGTGTTAISLTLANSGVAAGTYKSVTVDAKGRVTAGTNPTTLSGYGITDALSNSTTSTQDGYFGNIYLYDDSTPSHYLAVTNSANLTAARTLSVNVNDADRTISLSGNLTVSGSATVSGTNTGDQTITLTGDATGSGTGSFAVTLANSGVTAGTYKSVTVDAKGRVTAGTNPTTLSGYGITDAQPLDATLTALAGVTTAANTLIYATGADTFTTTSLTAFGRSLLDDADAAAGRTTLGLGTMSTQNANAVAITGGTIDGITFDMGTF